MENNKGLLTNLRSRHRSGMGTVALVVIIVVIIIIVVGGAVFYYLYLNPSTAKGGLGTSSIQLAQSSGSVAAGSSTTVSYTVSLASGSKWGTAVIVADNATLGSEGITATPSNGQMDPTFTGTLSIAASNSAKPGTYQINLKATGDDPSTSNAVFTLTVTAPSSSSSSSLSSSSTVASSSTTATATTSTTSSSYGGYGGY